MATPPQQFRGWLLKWTNYIKGYQRRWFVLENGMLSYYRTQEEMAHTCRGTINLAGALIDTIDSTNFVVSNGSSQVYHLRAQNKLEKQRWVTMLQLVKAQANKTLESDGSDSDTTTATEEDGAETIAAIADNLLVALHKNLRNLTTAHDLVAKNYHLLMKHITEADKSEPLAKIKEQLTLFSITGDAMVKAADEFVVQARNTDRRWSKSLQHEHSLRVQLQENIVTMANDLYGLENQAKNSVRKGKGAATPSVPTSGDTRLESGDYLLSHHPAEEPKLSQEEAAVSSDDEDGRFFDAPEISLEEWEKTVEASSEGSPTGGRSKEGMQRSTSLNEVSTQPVSPSDGTKQLPITSDRRMTLPMEAVPSFFVSFGPTLPVRRTSIPPRPQHRLNLWNLVKNCVGKDLTKIPMPVNLNEPVSLLQRMNENLLYADILANAAKCDNTLEEQAHVVAFVTSAYPHALGRINKPFNPLLGETYECDRRAESGWRSISEQVSHHPPMFAMHVEHEDWTYWEEYTIAIKFRGKYIACYPIGYCHVVFHRTKSHYTWTKVPTIIHNIIVGTLWIDLSGNLKVVNHTTGEKAAVKFHAYSYFSRERQRKVAGMVHDASGVPRYYVHGYWDEMITCAKIITGEGNSIVTEPAKTIWTANKPQPGSDLIYGFSDFSCTLNEMEEGIPPTDSRLRPDQRIMEKGDFDLANTEKIRLEEKQRAKRHKREALMSKAAEAAAAGKHEEALELEKEASYSPEWFQKEYDPFTNTMMHVFKGGYWETRLKDEWTDLPDLF